MFLMGISCFLPRATASNRIKISVQTTRSQLKDNNAIPRSAYIIPTIPYYLQLHLKLCYFCKYGL